MYKTPLPPESPSHLSPFSTPLGYGNPLQCSCLENPRDGGAWWAAVYGVAESDTTEATLQQQQQQAVTEPRFEFLESYGNLLSLSTPQPSWDPVC